MNSQSISPPPPPPPAQERAESLKVRMDWSRFPARRIGIIAGATAALTLIAFSVGVWACWWLWMNLLRPIN